MVFLPIVFPYKGVYYITVRARGPYPLRSGWCLDLPILEIFPLIRGIWSKRPSGRVTSGCWSVRLRVWRTWLVFKSSLILSAPVARRQCIVNSAAPKQSQISGSGTETSLSSHTHHRLLTVERTSSPVYYYAFETRGHMLRRHIFRLYKARHFQTSLFISKYQHLFEIITRSVVYQRCISISA